MNRLLSILLRPRKLLLWLAFLLLGSRWVCAELERAQPADAFVDSIGLNVHLGYNDTVYGNYSGIVRPRLQELGVRHIRDHVLPNRSDVISRLRDLHTRLGIRACLIADPRLCTTAQAKSLTKALGAPIVSIVEGPNEPDLNLGQQWINTTRSYQQSLYSSFKSDAEVAGIPIAASTTTTDSNATALGDLSAWTDFGNIHNYYAGHHPGSGGWGDNGYGSLTFHLIQARKICGTDPIVSTETGYHTATNSNSGHLATPEEVVAAYLPRLFAYHFYRGIMRTYAYELLDEGRSTTEVEHSFGLVRNDGTLKSSFVALRNLISVLGDGGTEFETGALDYTLSGSSANAYRLLLQKRDGAFYLLLWNEESRWDPLNKRSLAVTSRLVTLRLRTPIQSASVCIPNDGTNWANISLTDGSFSLPLTDKLAVLRLTPAASLGPAAALIPAGAEWKYLNDGSDQKTAWREVQFNDGNWPSGPAQLGYNHGGRTTIKFGTNSSSEFITAYFRHRFQIENPRQIKQLTVRLLRDDGAIVYLNGIEVFRSHMPTGVVTFSTRALSSGLYPAESNFYSTNVPTTLLVAGTNTLAVEVHQSSTSSDDLGFDLELLAENEVPRIQIKQKGNSINLRWPSVFNNMRVQFVSRLSREMLWQDLNASAHEDGAWQIVSNLTVMNSSGVYRLRAK